MVDVRGCPRCRRSVRAEDAACRHCGAELWVDVEIMSELTVDDETIERGTDSLRLPIPDEEREE